MLRSIAFLVAGLASAGGTATALASGLVGGQAPIQLASTAATTGSADALPAVSDLGATSQTDVTTPAGTVSVGAHAAVSANPGIPSLPMVPSLPSVPGLPTSAITSTVGQVLQNVPTNLPATPALPSVSVTGGTVSVGGSTGVQVSTPTVHVAAGPVNVTVPSIAAPLPNLPTLPVPSLPSIPSLPGVPSLPVIGGGTGLPLPGVPNLTLPGIPGLTSLLG